MQTPAFLIAFAFALVNCTTPADYYTDQGYGYTLNGTWSYKEGWFTRLDVARWLDERIEQWVTEHADLDPNELRVIAHDTMFQLTDDYYLGCGTISPSGYCAGAYVGNLAVSAIWGYRKSGATLEFRGPDRLRRYWDGGPNGYVGWLYGVIPLVHGIPRGLPAIPHELDHALGVR